MPGRNGSRDQNRPNPPVNMPSYLQEAGPRSEADAAMWDDTRAFLEEWNTHKLGDTPASDVITAATPGVSDQWNNYAEQYANAQATRYQGLQDTTLFQALGGLTDMDGARDDYWNLLWEEQQLADDEKRRQIEERYRKALAGIGGFDASPYLNNIAGVNASTQSFLNHLAPTVEARRNAVGDLVDPAEQAALRQMLADVQASELEGVPADLRDAFDLGTNTIGVMRQSGDAAAIEAMAAAVNEAAAKQLAAEQETELEFVDDVKDITSLIDVYRQQDAELQRADYERAQRTAMESARASHARSAAAARQRAEEARQNSLDDIQSRDDYFAELARDEARDRARATYDNEQARMGGAANLLTSAVQMTDEAVAANLLNGTFDAQSLFDATGRTMPSNDVEARALVPIIKYAARSWINGRQDLSDTQRSGLTGAS